MRPVAVALGLGLLALLLGLVLSLSHRERGIVGSNRVVVGGFPSVLDRRHPTACTRTDVPAHAGAVELVVRSGARPRPQVTVRVGERQGRAGAGPPRQQLVRVPVSGLDSGTRRVCVTSPTGARVPLGGGATGGEAVRYPPSGRRTPAFKITWAADGEETGWGRLGSVAKHFGWGKSGLLASGTSVLVFVGLLVLAALALVVRLVLRAPE